MKLNLNDYLKKNEIKLSTAPNFFKTVVSPSKGNEGVCSNLNNTKLIEAVCNSFEVKRGA